MTEMTRVTGVPDVTPQIGRVKLRCGFSTTTASVCRPNHCFLRDTADPLDVSDRADTVCTAGALPHTETAVPLVTGATGQTPAIAIPRMWMTLETRVLAVTAQMRRIAAQCQ